MEMTIDDAIAEVEQQKLDYQEFWEEYKNEHIEALELAISTMRKYQKIQEIINNAKDSDGAVKYNWLYEQIREVAEDGKID